MLKILTIILGILAIVSRGLIMLFPSTARSVLTGFAEKTCILRGTSLFLLVFSILVFYAVKISTAQLAHIMTAIGVVMFLAGLWILFMPAQFSSIVDWFMQLSNSGIRFFAGIGVCIGVLLVILGVKCY